MKVLSLALVFGLALALPRAASGQTEGTVTFTVRTTPTGSGYSPRHVLAVWITLDGQFVKTLKKRADRRQQYLYQWLADSRGNAIDGITGATLSSHQTHTLTWDCTAANGVLVPDGPYRIHVEFTERNGSGPWTADSIEFVKGPVADTVTVSDQAYFKNISVVYTPSVSTTTLVAQGDVWAYEDSGTDLHGTNWTSLAYDDGTWSRNSTRLGYGGDGESSPPLSYGSDSNNKHPCYYFRHEFSADAVPEIADLRVARDDGVVVYLNGMEIARSSMDPGPTRYDQYANATAEAADETTLFEFTVDPALVAVGRNLLAAEVHQVNGTSPDIGFNLDFMVGAATVVPHDIALDGTLPTLALVDSLVPIQLTARNLTPTLESIDVTLSNLTAGAAANAPVPVLLTNSAEAVVTLAWDTTGLAPGDYLIEARAGPIPGETSTADNVVSGLVRVRTPLHDVGVSSVTVQGDATEGDILDVAIAIDNLGTFAETFTVSLVDTNTGATVGTTVVTDLAALSSTIVTLRWPTLGAGVGTHALEVQISGVAGDADPDNDSAGTTGWIRDTGFGPAPIGEIGSLGGYSAAVDVEGTTLGLGAGARLVLLDVTTPNSPARLGDIRLPGELQNLTLGNGLACTANGNSGVHLVDITNPAAPTHLQTFDTSGFAHDVALDGTLLYIADGVSGIRVVDVTTPAAPSLVGAYATEGPARALAVDGSTLVVLDRNAGLRVLDATAPSALVPLASLPRPAFGTDLAVVGTTAYVVDESGYLSIIDLSIPDLVGRLRLDGPGQSIAVQAGTAYAAVAGAGVQVVDVSVATNPVQVVTYDTAGSADALALDTTQLWVADGFGGLLGLNVSSPALPSPRGTYDPGGRTTGIAILGDHAYVAAGARGLEVYDVSDPAAPQWVAADANPIQARDVAAEGALACVADGLNGVVVFDVSAPASPVYRATYTHPDLGFARRVIVRGTRAVVTDGSVVQQISLTDPQNPAWQATYASPGYAHDLAALDTASLVAAGSAGLIALDATVPWSSALDQLATPGPARAVAVSGTRAWVGMGADGWLEVDAANPASLVPLGSSTADGPVNELAAFSSLLHLADGGATITSRNLVLTPVTTASYTLLQQTVRAAADGPYLYVAEDAAGLTILDGSPGDHDLDRMPDAWEQAIVDASTTDAIETVDDVLPDDDFDGDSLSNLAESIAGTDATDPGSVFAVMSTMPGGGGTVDVMWHSVTGKTYAIHRSTNLADGFTLVQDGVAATPPVNTYPDSTAPDGQAFYLIEVRD